MKAQVAVLGALAALSLGGAHTAAVVRTNDAQRQVAASKAGQKTTREIEADHFSGVAGGLLKQYMRDSGNPPAMWGQSRACARMVRKNRLHRAGVGHARI